MFLEKDNLQTYNGCRAIKPNLGFLESECSSLSCVLLFAILVNVAPPGSSAQRILLTRLLEWVAISFSRVYF